MKDHPIPQWYVEEMVSKGEAKGRFPYWWREYAKKERIKRETEEAEIMHNPKPNGYWDI